MNVHAQESHTQQVFMATLTMIAMIGHAPHGNLQLICNSPSDDDDNNQDNDAYDDNSNAINENSKKDATETMGSAFSLLSCSS